MCVEGGAVIVCVVCGVCVWGGRSHSVCVCVCVWCGVCGGGAVIVCV